MPPLTCYSTSGASETSDAARSLKPPCGEGENQLDHVDGTEPDEEWSGDTHRKEDHDSKGDAAGRHHLATPGIRDHVHEGCCCGGEDVEEYPVAQTAVKEHEEDPGLEEMDEDEDPAKLGRSS